MKRRFLLFNLFISLVLIYGFIFYPSTANAAELPPKIGVGMFTDNTCIYADEMCTQLVAQCGTSEKGWYIDITGINSTGTAWQVVLNNAVFYIPSSQLTICSPEAPNTTAIIPSSDETITDWTHFRVNGQEYVVDQLNGLLASDVMLYKTSLSATKSPEYTEYIRNSPFKFGTDYRIENSYDIINSAIEVDCPAEYEASKGYNLNLIGSLWFGAEDNVLESAYNSHLYEVFFDQDCTDYANVEWLFGAAVGKEAAPIIAQIEQKYGKLTFISTSKTYFYPKESNRIHYKNYYDQGYIESRMYEKDFGDGKSFIIGVDTTYGLLTSIKIINKVK